MIDAEELVKAGIDYDAGMQRFMNDAALYEAVLNAFISDNILDKAAKAFYACDYEMLLMTVHEAKGSSGNAGLNNLYQASSKLVALLRTKEYTEDELTECYNKFQTCYKNVWNGIKSALN